MSYRGVRNWPPVWTAGFGLGLITLKGELGVLRRVILLHKDLPNRCYLVIEHETQHYMGCLIFDDVAFCRQVYDLLRFYVGSSIQDIGSVDLNYLA